MPINSTAIDHARVATISEWKNNCAVAVIGDFVVEQLKQNKLPATAVAALVTLVKDYYAIPTFTADDLKALFGEDYFNTPNHAQEILGCVFRNYLQKLKIADVSDQLSSDAFKPIADLLQFGVRFYIEETSKEAENGSVISLAPDLEVNSDEDLKLDVVWHNSVNIKDPLSIKKRDFHYDRLMPNEAAAKAHDAFIAEQNQSYVYGDVGKYVSLERDNEEAMKEQIRSAITAIRTQENNSKDASKNIFIQPLTESSPSRHILTPSANNAASKLNTSSAISPAHAATSKSVASPSWKDVVMNTVNREHLTIQTDEKAVVEELRQRQVSLPTKSFVMYTLWKNDRAQDQVVCVDTETQVAWDAKLAEEIERELNSHTPRM